MTILLDRLFSGNPRLACGRLVHCVLTMMTVMVAAVTVAAAQGAPSPPGPAVFYAPIEPLAATLGRMEPDEIDPPSVTNARTGKGESASITLCSTAP